MKILAHMQLNTFHGKSCATLATLLCVCVSLMNINNKVMFFELSCEQACVAIVFCSWYVVKNTFMTVMA